MVQKLNPLSPDSDDDDAMTMIVYSLLLYQLREPVIVATSSLPTSHLVSLFPNTIIVVVIITITVVILVIVIIIIIMY